MLLYHLNYEISSSKLTRYLRGLNHATFQAIEVHVHVEENNIHHV